MAKAAMNPPTSSSLSPDPGPADLACRRSAHRVLRPEVSQQRGSFAHDALRLQDPGNVARDAASQVVADVLERPRITLAVF